MGVVSNARDTQLGRVVTVKVVDELMLVESFR
jgi:hypothetical protein